MRGVDRDALGAVGGDGVPEVDMLGDVRRWQPDGAVPGAGDSAHLGGAVPDRHSGSATGRHYGPSRLAAA